MEKPIKKEIRQNIFAEIEEERLRQIKKFGKQVHDPYKWITILTEEVGEISKCSLELDMTKVKDVTGYLAEVIQAAAVCVAMAECIIEQFQRGRFQKTKTQTK